MIVNFNTLQELFQKPIIYHVKLVENFVHYTESQLEPTTMTPQSQQVGVSYTHSPSFSI